MQWIKGRRLKYKHLIKANFNQKFIANELGVSEFNREFRRNSSSQRGSYSVINAHKVSRRRQASFVIF